jgi:hypothetical protein
MRAKPHRERRGAGDNDARDRRAVGPSRSLAMEVGGGASSRVVLPRAAGAGTCCGWTALTRAEFRRPGGWIPRGVRVRRGEDDYFFYPMIISN